MARAATTADVFNAIAEPRRRAIIDALAECGAQSVNALVAMLRLTQPTVSKHLSVLRRVGVVSVAKEGRQRVYSLDADELKPVHEWAQTFERLWDHQLMRIKERAERSSGLRSASDSDTQTTKDH